MIRIALAFGVLAAACSAASAQAEFEPTPDERKAIAACLERVIGQPELKQMAECIGIRGADRVEDAERAWIAFRDAKCGYWEKRYAGGTFASVVTGDCMRAETGSRALEMRAIFDDLDH